VSAASRVVFFLLMHGPIVGAGGAPHKPEVVSRTSPGSGAGAGSAAADAPFDATALASPIAMRVEEVVQPQGAGDCQSRTMRVHLTDAHGKAVTFDYGSVSGVAGDAAVVGGFLAAKDGAFVDAGMSCAGLRVGYTVKASGDTLVAIDSSSDEQGGDSTATAVIAKLPPGATVTAQ
jgi:hypothetical protein